MVDLNETLQILLGFIGILGAVIAVFQWKIKQIKQDAKDGISSQKDIQSNQNHIKQVDEEQLAMAIRLSNLEKDVARLQGEFSQHVREQKE